ncbi:MAG: hypothetical protein EP344_19870 [Bacteroidetes bacterium]|nr:MAG: hypothetical protein EP344_19870 [Bacteroidota bacterium]
MRDNILSSILRVAYALIFFLCTQPAFAQGNKNLTGTWVTEKPVTYLVEFTEEHPQGEIVANNGIQILERSAILEWTLEQRPDGLITGVNNWAAFDESGTKVFEGQEALLGFFDGQAGMLSEPADEAKQTAQINFEFKIKGQNKIQGFAYNVGSVKLLAMRFELVRK